MLRGYPAVAVLFEIRGVNWHRRQTVPTSQFATGSVVRPTGQRFLFSGSNRSIFNRNCREAGPREVGEAPAIQR